MLAVTAAIAVVGPAAPVAAHGQLVFAEPAKDSVIATPIDSIALYFTERPASNAFFTIVAPDGGRVEHGWSGGEPRQLDRPVQEYFLRDGAWEPRVYATGFPIVVRFAHWPATGRYTISYLSVATDGEEVKGELSLTYSGPTTPPPAGWQPPTSQPDPGLVAASAGADGRGQPPTAAAPTGPDGSGGSWWVWVLPAVLVVGVVVIVIRAGLPRPAASSLAPSRASPRSSPKKATGRRPPSRKRKPKSPTPRR